MRSRSRKRKYNPSDRESAEAGPARATRKISSYKERPGPFYRAGPAVRLEERTLPAQRVKEKGEEEAPPAFGRSLRIHGVTEPGDFDYEAHTENLRVEQAEGCSGCGEGDDCLRVRGTLVATYHVSPTISVPSASDYPDLTPCQRQRVQAFIDNVLLPHERAHKRAFESYNGTTRRDFDVKVCRSAWNQAYVDGMVESEQRARQQAAQAASDNLDPFEREVDLECEDEEEPEGEGGGEENREAESES